MKKLLLISVLVFGFIFMGSAKIGAKMTNDIKEVRAEHILVQTKDEALDLKTKIDNHEMTFEEAAKKFSKCPSGRNGGDLGYFGRGMMVKEFEEAAFEGDENKVSDPVQTQFGWHLIKVIDKK